MGSLIASVAILLGLVFGGVALLVKGQNNYWKEAQPCGSSSQGSFISNDKGGSWVEYRECRDQ